MRKAVAYAAFSFQIRVAVKGSPEQLASRVPYWCGVPEPLDDERSQIVIGSNSAEGLVAQLAVIGMDFELLEPKSLEPEVHAVLGRLRAGIGD